MKDEKLLYEVRERAKGMGFSARWLMLELASRYEMATEPKMLKIYPARGSGKSGPLERALRDLDFARTEGIKEFADKLTDRICDKSDESLANPGGSNYFIPDVLDDINNLKKEMVGESV